MNDKSNGTCSLTDELREWVREYGPQEHEDEFFVGKFGGIGRDRLLAIADRIDEEHCRRMFQSGNCDRYDKPLTSIEQPACDAYEIHPLLAENAKLRELVTRIWRTARLMDANEHIDGMRITDEFRASCEAAFAELGIGVDDGAK